MYILRACGLRGSANEIRRESPPTEDSLERLSGEGAVGRCLGIGVSRPVPITGGGSDWVDLCETRDLGLPPLRPDLESKSQISFLSPRQTVDLQLIDGHRLRLGEITKT